jgi:hypothetical protein
MASFRKPEPANSELKEHFGARHLLARTAHQVAAADRHVEQSKVAIADLAKRAKRPQTR